MSQRDLIFSGSRPRTFPSFGTYEPGQRIAVDNDVAERLLSTGYFKPARAMEAAAKKDGGSNGNG